MFDTDSVTHSGRVDFPILSTGRANFQIKGCLGGMFHVYYTFHRMSCILSN